VRGRIVAPEYQDGEDELATGQFEINDERSPAEIAAVLRRRGLDPVWKDWDQILCSA
jgi:2-iminoacetate synthase